MKRKTVLITGASRGIGYGIAEEFAKSGYDLILTCNKNIDRLLEIKKNFEKEYGCTCITFSGDLSKSDVVDNLFEEIDKIDVLVNNAGIAYVGQLQDMSDEAWNSVLGCNLNSVFYCCRRAIPIMLKEKRGSIINISSVFGLYGGSMEVAYSASKGGMNAFTRALAKELGPSHISVNAIACGLIDTDMNANLSSDEMEYLIEEIPASRAGTPKDVGQLAVKIAGMSDYFTGQIIQLDGGWF